MARKPSWKARFQGRGAYWTLIALIVAVFAMGGASRDDAVSLILLRPFAVFCLAIGLAGLTRDHWQSYKVPLAFMGAIIALIVLHMVPLPPAIWTLLPGRELAVDAGAAMGGTQPWRPIALVPYRTANAFFAMLVPAAAMVLAVQLAAEDRKKILYVFVAVALASVLWGIIQTVGGYSRSFHLYAVSTKDAPTGIFANRNHYAAWLVLMFPILSLIASRLEGPSKLVGRVVCGALAGLFLLMALGTGSRGGLVFALIALGGAAMVWWLRPRSRVNVRRGSKDLRPYFATAGAILGIAGIAIVMSQGEAFDRFMAPDQAEQGRALAWRTTAGFLPHYLPFGSGIGSFVEIFQVHEPRAMLELNYWNHAHNDWLEWALEGGLPAIVLMLAGIVFFIAAVRRLWRNRHAGRFDIQLGLTGSVILFVLGLWSLVDYPLRTPSLASFAAIWAVWMVIPRGSKTGEI